MSSDTRTFRRHILEFQKNQVVPQSRGSWSGPLPKVRNLLTAWQTNTYSVSIPDYICRNFSWYYVEICIFYCNCTSWRDISTRFYWEDISCPNCPHQQRHNRWVEKLQRDSFRKDSWGCICAHLAQSRPGPMLPALGRAGYPANPSRRRIGHRRYPGERNPGSFW